MLLFLLLLLLLFCHVMSYCLQSHAGINEDGKVADFMRQFVTDDGDGGREANGH